MKEIKLQTGRRHVVTARFEKMESKVVRGEFFATNSAFPTPGVFLMLDQIGQIAEGQPETKFVAIGHTDEKGGEGDNKQLADRRAKAVMAMLTRDLELFDALAEEDGWEIKHYQAMLRGLGCNPGAIDNDEGDLTKEAVSGFQDDYNEDAYHPPESTKQREQDDLKVDGVLGPNTKKALHDAYVSMSPAFIDPARFVGPKFIGCGEYNLDPELDDELQRCVMVAIIQGDKIPKFPCTEGDTGACQVDQDEAPRCKFYRRYLDETRSPMSTRAFFNLQWLAEGDDKVHLSALTTLPDGTSVTFKVFSWLSEMPDNMPASTEKGQTPEEPGEPIAEIEGAIACGVAYARWTLPEDFDPFDYGDWLVPFDLGSDTGSPPDLDRLYSAQRVTPPVFLVQADERWAFSDPPGHSISNVRLQAEDEEEADEESDEDKIPTPDKGDVRGASLTADGSVLLWKAKGNQVEVTVGEPNARLFNFAVGGNTIATTGLSDNEAEEQSDGN